MEYSQKGNDSSEDVFQDQSEEYCRSTSRAIEENVPSLGEHASENPCSPSPRSVVSCQLVNQSPTPSLLGPIFDQFDEIFSSTNINSSRDLQSHTNYSSNKDAVISPRQDQTASSISILDDSDVGETKTNQKNRSPFAASRNADFDSPPERGTSPRIKSLSKNLKETNTPSPEKRSVEADVELTPTKRLRKPPRSDSGKPKTEAESHRSKLRLLAVSKTLDKSPTDQQMKVAIQKNNEWKSPNSPSTPRKRKISKSGPVDEKTAIRPCLSNSISPSSAANISDESPTHVEIHGSLPTKELESIVSNELTDDSSNQLNLREIHSTSDITGESPLRNFTPKRADTIMHPTTLVDHSFIRPNISGKQRDRPTGSDVSGKVSRSNLPVKDTESTLRSLSLTDQTYNSNRGPASKSQNPKTKDFESCIKVKKIQNLASVSAEETQSSSNVANSLVEAQVLESSQSGPVILNPPLSSSCHLPRRSNFSVTNVPRRELDTSGKKVGTDKNRPSSTRTSTQDGESRSQSKKLSSLRGPGIHRRSVSDGTLTSRNLSEVQELQDQSNSLTGSQSKERSTSRSLLDISKGVNRTTCIVQPLFHGMPPRSTSNTTSAMNNPLEFSLSGRSNQLFPGVTQSLPSDESFTSRSNPELQMHQNRNTTPLLQSRSPRFFSGEASTSRNQPEEASGMNTPYIDIVEGQASSSNYQPVVTDDSYDHQLDSLSHFLNSFLDSRSGEPRERTRGISEPFTEARFILSSVLRNMMLYNDENGWWRGVEPSFRRISELTERDSMNLCLKLTFYLNYRISNYGINRSLNVLMADGITAETSTLVVYENLISSVVFTLSYILSVPITRDFDAFIHCYSLFRSLYDDFLEDSSDFNVDDIQDEATKNRVKALHKMIHSLMLQTLSAIRLLLMYIGENSDDGSIEIYEPRVKEEDKMFLRRNIE